MNLPRQLIPFSCATFLLGLLGHLWRGSTHVKTTELEISTQVEAIELEAWNLLRGSEPHSEFWRQFAPILKSTEPNCNGTKCGHSEMPEDARAKGRANSTSWQTDEPQSMVTNSEDWISSLTVAHSVFVNAITKETPQLEYIKGSRGIVTTAGDCHNPVLLVSLLMLRRNGSKLPVEVLVTREEYEPQICDSKDFLHVS